MRTPRPPHRIVLGLDGSDGSAHACHWCAALAHSLDAEVVAVHAMEVPAYPLVTYEGLQPIPLDAEILLRWQEDGGASSSQSGAPRCATRASGIVPWWSRATRRR